MASRSGKVLVQNSADIFRKEEEEEEEEVEGKKLGLHLILSSKSWNPKRRYRFYDISCYDEKWSRQSSLRFPFPTTASRFRGSCNGLLCLEFIKSTGYSNGIGNKYVVWEPSTNTLQVIPRPTSMNRPCAASSCSCSSKRCCLKVMTDASGLHFDSQSQDYKFFSFTENSYTYRDDDMPICHDVSYHAQVYSLKNNVWKELTYPLPKVKLGKKKKKKKKRQLQIVPCGTTGIFLNGVCYWDACCGADFYFILSYSFLTEEFSSFHKPKLNGNDNAKLVELDGSVGLLIYPTVRKADWKGIIRLMVYSSSSSSSPAASWSRVDGFDEVPVVGHHEPVWFGKKNDTYYLLLKGAQGDLVEYDYARKVFNKVYKSKFSPAETRVFVYETKTKTKNNANIWHSSSFHQLQLQKRFAVYASECDQGGGDDNY